MIALFGRQVVQIVFYDYTETTVLPEQEVRYRNITLKIKRVTGDWARSEEARLRASEQRIESP